MQRHDGTDSSDTMVPITVLRMVPIQRYRQDPWCDYCGRTALIDPYGRVAASCGEGERVVTGDIDMDRLTAFRRKFPVLEDRDAWQADELWRG